MSTHITPEQVQNLVMLSALILVAVVVRIVCIAYYNKFLKDIPGEELTQEERDERRVARVAARRR